MKRFGLIGVAGYVAPRHLQAIKATGNTLSVAMDKFDAAGVLDSYFPDASFFTEFERFDRHLEKAKRKGEAIDWLSICSPNYLHDAHIRYGLRYGADVICEKPLVLNPWNLTALQEIARETGRKVNCILQLRLHPNVIALKEKIDKAPKDKKWDIDLSYITSRGNWYYASWKGDIEKSGGIATNIGIHFFDMLHWIFGETQSLEVHVHTHDRAAGFIEFANARVRWFLSINNKTLPPKVVEQGGRTFRSLHIDGEDFDFSSGFRDLHTLSYESILKGEGFNLEVSRAAIEIVHRIRNQSPLGLKGDYHPMAKLPLEKHPFYKT